MSAACLCCAAVPPGDPPDPGSPARTQPDACRPAAPRVLGASSASGCRFFSTLCLALARILSPSMLVSAVRDDAPFWLRACSQAMCGSLFVHSLGPSTHSPEPTAYAPSISAQLVARACVTSLSYCCSFAITPSTRVCPEALLPLVVGMILLRSGTSSEYVPISRLESSCQCLTLCSTVAGEARATVSTARF